jgi:hypothetical protein
VAGEAPTLGAKGFLVERTRQPLDTTIAFQLDTGVIREEDLRRQGQPASTDILNLRVLEIKKRKLDTAVLLGLVRVNGVITLLITDEDHDRLDSLWHINVVGGKEPEDWVFLEDLDAVV